MVQKNDDTSAENDAGKKGTVPRNTSAPGDGNSAIPVLRTYEHDARTIKGIKGNAGVRATIAAEKDKKQKAKEDYSRQVKDLLKDSLVLKEKQRSFLAQKSGKSPDRKPPAVDTKPLADMVSGAAEYMKTARASVSPDAGDEKRTPIPLDDHPDSTSTPAPSTVTEPQSGILSRIQQRSARKIPLHTVSPAVPKQAPATPRAESAGGILSRIQQGVFRSGEPKEKLTEEERTAMREQQREIVEKEHLRSAWKSFEKKKEKLQQMGLEARDIRSYGIEAAPRGSPVRRQSALTLLITVILIGALGITVYSVLTRPQDQPGTVPLEELRSVPDVISTEEEVFISIGNLEDEWARISQPSGNRYGFTKFIPYRTTDSGNIQIDLPEFSRLFSVQFPDKLLSSFGSYYFVGRYLSDSGPQGVFIVSVENYGDALVRLLDWERNVINSFVSMFPGLLREGNANLTAVARSVIDNKDVRILSNGEGNVVRYYFFNRGILVFTIGEDSIISMLNNRIRSSNAL